MSSSTGRRGKESLVLTALIIPVYTQTSQETCATGQLTMNTIQVGTHVGTRRGPLAVLQLAELITLSLDTFLGRQRLSGARLARVKVQGAWSDHAW